MTWRWLNWFTLSDGKPVRLPSRTLAKDYVMLQLAAAFEVSK